MLVGTQCVALRPVGGGRHRRLTPFTPRSRGIRSGSRNGDGDHRDPRPSRPVRVLAHRLGGPGHRSCHCRPAGNRPRDGRRGTGPSGPVGVRSVARTQKGPRRVGPPPPRSRLSGLSLQAFKLTIRHGPTPYGRT
ncbi:hypothetical protein SGM_5863 [Streptomyces griseoaurantiacus M045]|uniref:Uncharacterized protein n=1 Tax=Streptomyces griseoaurantiacus M045 TaxID=996637 RepID=F3NRU9_9ACTN|nr:hypothetical protein SGM_5863 [Streptomyces griseoaurantiacus M045]